MPGAPEYAGGIVKPAGHAVAFVISTPSILRFARSAQEFTDWAFAATKRKAKRGN